MGIIQEFFAKIGDAIDAFLDKFTSSVLVKSMIKVGTVFVLIIVVIVLFASCGKKKTYTYEEFLGKMVTMTATKYKKSDKLPDKDKETLTVSLQEFVDDKTIKDVSSLLKSGASCTGEIKIINNNGYYLYVPALDCGDKYKTTTLYETLVTEDNIVTEGNGIYKLDDDYIYRGDKVKNFIKIGEALYRIIRFNADGTVRIIAVDKTANVQWDNRYNVDKKLSVGINNYYANGINSRIKDTVEKMYNEKTMEELKPFFVNHDVCIGKRSVDDDIFDTSIECEEKIEEFPYTLLYPYEYYLASLDENCLAIKNSACQNYNFFSSIGNVWTMTGDDDTSYSVYKITETGAELSRASTRSAPKIVTHINGELLLEGGTGSEEDPFVVRTFVTIKKKK